MRRRIEFVIHGRAATAGSKRGYPIKRKDGTLGVVMAPDNKRAKPWMAAVTAAAREAYSGAVIEGAVSLSVTFYRLRPKSHFRTGKNSDKLKHNAPVYPTTKPDSTKLIRCLEDALTGVIWRDDSQVVELFVRKRWGAHDYAAVEIEEMR